MTQSPNRPDERVHDGERPTLAVCAACGDGAGQRLLERIRVGCEGVLAGRPVPCFAVCDRPVTVAFISAGKWSYLIGEVDPDIALSELVEAADAVGASASGIPPLRNRPPFFRRGVIARLPPVADLESFE
ncbi:DUF1636 domain-containing protein [Acuticoccus yangtzensis]|uniref:DUF1636 domain-containing protein n=1 Tax=Acuticoccus yangtzensis TaxID=1443441 RepID=UPI000B27B611|nr:DUF1636 domain-containing protein [Acuticoccus yangtzensis]